MNSRALVIPLIACSACYRHREVQRSDWPAISETNSITVRTLDGKTGEFNAFAFTPGGLSAWRRVGTLQEIRDSTLIPLDSIAVVRASEFNRGGTMMLLAGATTAAFIVLQAAQSNERPQPVPRPASCPFIYSFDGHDYVFDSETYAGAVARGLERTDVDNLEHLRAVDGRYRLRVKNDRNETDYTDELALVVVDHPRQTRAIPDASGGVHVVREGIRPTHTREYGGDTIPSRAGWELAFVRPPNAGDTVALVVRTRNTQLAPFVILHTLSLLGADVYAWYASMRTQLLPRAVVRSWMETEGYLEVRTASGDGSAWRTVARLPNVGAAIAKSNVVLLDLSKMNGDTVRVRVESSPGLWLLEDAELAGYHGRAATQTLRPIRAVDERGADVRSLLTERDGKYQVATRGSDVTLEYEVPPVTSGSEMMRSVLARTTGHYIMETDERGPPRRDVVERLMSDRAFAQAYFADAWTRAGGTPLIRTRQ